MTQLFALDSRPRRELQATAQDAAIVFLIVLAASMIGSATRPAGLLSTIWPANALLLGLFVRCPRLATPLGWTAAAVAYLTCDLMAGDAAITTLLLTAANLSGVATGFALYMRLDEHDRHLKRPFSVLYLGLITSAAAAAAGVVGAFANPILFHGTALMGAAFWFVSEFVNYIAFLPVALTFPAPATGSISDAWREYGDRKQRLDVVPLLALIVSCVASLWLGGPGAVVFPIPGLLWCALTYQLPGTALVTLFFSAWTLVAISSGAIPVGADFNSKQSLLSIRTGVALMALAPITVASVMAARTEFQVLLQRMVTNDPLTAALGRRAFLVRCRNLLSPLAGTDAPVAVLLINIDQFKEINRVYGLAGGDELLKILARTARTYLPESEDLGRLDGDEFAVLLPGFGREDTTRIAQGIYEAFGDKARVWTSDAKLRPSVTIGVAVASKAPASVEPLLAQADKALSQAKAAGGNQVAGAQGV